MLLLGRPGRVAFRRGSIASTSLRAEAPGSSVWPSCQLQSPLSISPKGVWQNSHVCCQLQAASQQASARWGAECALWDTKESGNKNTEINGVVVYGNQVGKFSPVSVTGLGAVRIEISRLPGKKKNLWGMFHLQTSKNTFHRRWELMKTSWSQLMVILPLTPVGALFSEMFWNTGAPWYEIREAGIPPMTV